MHRSIITNQIAIKSHSCMLYVVKLSVSNRYPLMIFHKSIVPAKLGVCHDRHSFTSKPDTFNVLWKNYCFFFPLLMLCKSIYKLYNPNLPFMHYKTWFPKLHFLQTQHLVKPTNVSPLLQCNRRSCIYRGSENLTKSQTCETSRGSTLKSCVSSDWTSSWPGSRSSPTSWRRCTRWSRWAGTQSWN